MIGFSLSQTRNNAKQIAGNIRRNKIRLLNQFGEDVHRIAAASMRTVPENSDQTSRPFSPPYVRSPEPNLTTIKHNVDPSGNGVIVGPIRKQSAGNLGRPTSSIMERGGMVVRKARRNGQNLDRVIRYRVQPRPSIRPAAMQSIQLLKNRLRSRGIAR